MILINKKIVITGAGQGFGLELAKALIKKKAEVMISDIQTGKLRKTAKQIGALGFVADVTKQAEVKKLVWKAVKAMGRIDLWVNNAGVWLPYAKIEDLEIKKVHEMMQVNFFGVMYGCRAVIKQMKKQKSGMIININSKSGLSGRPLSSAYCASKWAVRGFSKSLRLEVKKDKIKIMEVYPGKMKTGLFVKEKPLGYKYFPLPELIVEKVIKNLEKIKPKEELIV